MYRRDGDRQPRAVTMADKTGKKQRKKGKDRRALLERRQDAEAAHPEYAKRKKKKKRPKEIRDDKLLRWCRRSGHALRALWGRFVDKVGRGPAVVGVSGVVILTVIVLVWIGVSRWRADKQRSAIDRAQTINQMKEVTETYPDAPDLLLRLGTAYALRADEGDLVRAESVLQRAFDSARDSSQKALVALELGKAKIDLEKYEQALTLFDVAVRDTDILPLTRDAADWYAGRCLEQLGRAKEAAVRYARVTARKTGGIWGMLAAHRQIKLRQEALD